MKTRGGPNPDSPGRCTSRPAIGRRRDARRPQQGQPQRIVVRLVRSILAVRQNGRPEAAVFIGKIDPAVRRNLKLTLVRIRSLNGSNLPVVGCVWIARTAEEMSP